ncbi:multiple sugar transport system ATP-binding protein [Mycoplasmoides fastidiosum]|uniref:Multiple sugar transport system ATP-binding protein n=1 Tax=Mycoplasmoides fastidiosum TaxID=92758 RepID=A0ABU0LZY8_9BACT|nr:ATP-binding cassette domain-containing protein [Mycoplasmoides fastidiosum]MDQ0514248.1 multiple sugar transport system ATP-binding protein [Mycoplasmoides fastidiosum]UUD37344.1 ATP-binding cassette domain-containing protein [Mycoplasmoides fastidiosum]
MRKIAIAINNLSIEFHKKLILENLNLEIYENTLTCLLGSSGTGKTTLINALVGLLKPTKGSVVYKNPSWKSNLGFVFQDSMLYDEISVYKNIYLSIKNSYDWVIKKLIKLIQQFIDQNQIDDSNFLAHFQQLKNCYDEQKSIWKIWQKLYQLYWVLIRTKKINLLLQLHKVTNLKKHIKNEIEVLSKNLKIDHILKNKASQISGGQRQRVAIAKALIKNSKIIFMDEPFSSLDADTKTQARDWLREIQRKFKLTVLMVTHDQNDAVLISDYIIYLSDKKVQQYDHPERFFEQPYNLEIAEFIGYPKINFLKEENGVKHFIRPKHLKLEKDPNGEFVITNIINTGNFNICEVLNEKTQLKLSAFLSHLICQTNDRVNISYKPEAVIKFNQQGINLVYEKQN